MSCFVSISSSVVALLLGGACIAKCLCSSVSPIALFLFHTSYCMYLLHSNTAVTIGFTNAQINHNQGFTERSCSYNARYARSYHRFKNSCYFEWFLSLLLLCCWAGVYAAPVNVFDVSMLCIFTAYMSSDKRLRFVLVCSFLYCIPHMQYPVLETVLRMVLFVIGICYTRYISYPVVVHFISACLCLLYGNLTSHTGFDVWSCVPPLWVYHLLVHSLTLSPSLTLTSVCIFLIIFTTWINI